MASSRMIATRKRGVFMVHICSECGFPMITVVQIESESEKTYTFSQSIASQIASDTAENAITDEIKRIESCYNTKTQLVGKQKGSGMISPGYFCTSSFSGYVSQCPKCLNVEPWKSSSSKKKMDDLERDNFPVVCIIKNQLKELVRSSAEDTERGCWKQKRINSRMPPNMNVQRSAKGIAVGATTKSHHYFRRRHAESTETERCVL